VNRRYDAWTSRAPLARWAATDLSRDLRHHLVETMRAVRARVYEPRLTGALRRAPRTGSANVNRHLPLRHVVMFTRSDSNLSSIGRLTDWKIS
jgi:hypothetical protein